MIEMKRKKYYLRLETSQFDITRKYSPYGETVNWMGDGDDYGDSCNSVGDGYGNGGFYGDGYGDGWVDGRRIGLGSFIMEEDDE